MALRKDESTGAGRGRVVDSKRDGGGLVIYRSNFDAGFDGWTDHWDNFRPGPIVSLTNHAQHVGQRSLMLSTSEGPYVSGDWSNNTSTFKRMAIYRDFRFHSFSAYLATGIGGYSSSLGSYYLYIDTQEFDNSQRSFYQVQYEARPNPDFNRWQIRNDAATFVTVPGSEHKALGDNDNKNGFQYVRLTIDKEANGGLGGYHALQVNKFEFDLTGLGAGSALEPPQASGELIAEFNGGFNIGLGLSRNNGVAGGCQLYADDIVYSVSDTY